MVGRGKYFELLDFPKFAYPSVVGMDAGLTANNLIERLAGKSFMSYSMIWSRLEPIVAGHATESFITSEFTRYEDKWKNDSLKDVARLLKDYFGGRGGGTGIPIVQRRFSVFGSSRALKAFGGWTVRRMR